MEEPLESMIGEGVKGIGESKVSASHVQIVWRNRLLSRFKAASASPKPKEMVYTPCKCLNVAV